MTRPISPKAIAPPNTPSITRIKTVAIYGTLGTGVPEILVFETDSHEDIRKMISFWRDTTEFEVYPALDLAADFRKQGMKVS